MSPRYPPSIFIGGVLISGNALGDGLLPLASIRLRWGQSDIYATTPPAQVSIELLDETGGWATRTELVGTELLMTRPGGTFFRGTVGEVTVTTLTVMSEYGKPYDVYQVGIVATDPLADLDMAVVPGPGTSVAIYGPGKNFIYGADHWSSSPAVSRRADLMAGGALGGASRFVTAIDPLPAYPAGYVPLLSHTKFSERVSLLGLIERFYRHYPMAHVNYNPATNTIEPGLPAASVGLALVWAGPTIVLRPNAGHVVPSRDLAVERPTTITSTVLNSIDAVLVNWRSEVPTVGPLEDGSYEPQAPGSDDQSTRVRTLNDKGDKTLSYDTSLGSPTAAAQLGALVAASIEGVNNQFEMPSVTYDFRRSVSGDAAIDALLLDTKSHPTPIYLAASRFGHLPNVGPMFQIIGGELEWHPQKRGSAREAGWTHRLRLAPTVGAMATLTVGQTWIDPTASLGQLDPAISLADLGNVTIGLSA